MKGHIRERAPGRWAIVLDLRDPLCTPVAALFRAEKPGPPEKYESRKNYARSLRRTGAAISSRLLAPTIRTPAR